MKLLLCVVALILCHFSAHAYDICTPAVFPGGSFTPLLPLQELQAIAKKMQGYKVKSGVIHAWRGSGSENAFMHARANPMAHWLAVRLILKRVADLTKKSHWNLEEQLQRGVPLAFFNPEFDDIVNGDPHMGNIGLIPLAGPQIHRHDVMKGDPNKLYMHLVFNDVDDAGYGPLFGDFLRSAATAALAGVAVPGLTEAYAKGLGHGPLVPPDWIEPCANLSIDEFDELQVKKTKKLFRDNMFYKKDVLISYDIENSILHTIARLFPDTVVDLTTAQKQIARYRKSFGGSGDIDRYLCLRRLCNGRLVVSELKWITNRPGIMGYYPNQPPPGARFDSGIAQMWRSRNYEVYRVSLDGQDYMVRPRYENPIKKEVQKRLTNKDDLTDWAHFSAELLGENHDLSPTGADRKLLKYIDLHPEGFLNASEQMVYMINVIFDFARTSYTQKGAKQALRESEGNAGWSTQIFTFVIT